MDLGGQPDSIAVSPDGNYAVIAIENERDEDLGDGVLPQLPGGWVSVLDISSDNVLDWTITEVILSNVEGIEHPEDSEPEYVSINENNIAVVTLQENNGIILVDLQSKSVTCCKSYSKKKDFLICLIRW